VIVALDRLTVPFDWSPAHRLWVRLWPLHGLTAKLWRRFLQVFHMLSKAFCIIFISVWAA